MRAVNEIPIDLSHIQKELELYIDTDTANALFINEDKKYNEAQYQIKEGHYYDYKFSVDDYRLSCSDQKNIISQRKRDKHAGQIAPNIYVGTLQLQIENEKDPSKNGILLIEVQSEKTTYREDYQFMLNEIAEKCTDLILQANSPVSHTFETDPKLDNETLYQRFAFIKAMIESEDFDQAMHRIISAPTTHWTSYEENTDVRSIKKFSAKNLRQLIHGANRVPVPTTNPIRNTSIKNIATRIEAIKKTESVDTPENRFIKHALGTFLLFCEDIAKHQHAGDRLKLEARTTAEILDSYLQQNIFKDVSRPNTLKLNSPVLQKKEGYRQVLKKWLNFDLAAKLIWEGGDDIYKGGKKDIATLYEYWLFFELVALIEKLFKIKPADLKDLIKPSKDGLSLQIKQGKFTAIGGVYTQQNRNLNVQFNYNRPFHKQSNIKKSGSWTTSLRPDYTLSMWPLDISEVQAEDQGEIVHVHFDAKYKIANIQQIIRLQNDDELSEEKKDNLKGIYKNVDLLKMHAYKDAIRRTGGAYVLYPGDTNKELKGFHEILPGLGAFSVKPKKGQNATNSLEEFLKKVLSHFMNRASQRENFTSKTYEITREEPDTNYTLNEPLPEYINDRKLIPDDTFVLVGYAKSKLRKKRMEWFLKHEKYNFRMNGEKGGLEFTEKEAKAKFLLIRDSTNGTATNLYKLKSGIQVFTGKKLKDELKHPDATKDAYLVVEFEKDILPEFKDVIFDYANTKEYKALIAEYGETISAKGEPFTTSITELLKNKNSYI